MGRFLTRKKILAKEKSLLKREALLNKTHLVVNDPNANVER